MSSEASRPPRRANLAEYYKQQAATSSSPAAATSATAEDTSPYNMNGPGFDADKFTQKLITEASLSQLIAKESEVVRQIGSLDSDMQTLVYENYNKFIAATDTIKKMRVDFRAMEDQMDQLAAKMQTITVFSGQITDTLRDRREQIGKLSETHSMLQKMQFLFELPAKLKECLSEDGEDLATGVAHYLRAQRVLKQYEHMASFKGIREDCDHMMLELKKRLLERLANPEMDSEGLGECVNLLLQLEEDPEKLCHLYLATAKKRLRQDKVVIKLYRALRDSLDVLKRQAELCSKSPSADAREAPMDLLEFVDLGCNSFLSDLSLSIAAYNETFLQNKAPCAKAIDQTMATEKLSSFVGDLIDVFLNYLKLKFRHEQRLEDTPVRVKALDRFYRRLQAMSRLLPATDFSRAGLDLILEASELHCQLSLKHLQDGFHSSLMDARQSLVAPRSRLAADSEHEADLSELNTSLLSSVAELLRGQMENLQQLVDPQLTFAAKTYFRAKYCRNMVREGVVVAFFRHIIEVAESFCSDTERQTPPAFLLLLSRACFDLQLNTVQYLLALCDEAFFIDDATELTTVSKVNIKMKGVAHRLLNHYMKTQGGVLSQMLRKSVETRDWLNTVEPRTVRAVMKRVVEEVTTIDRQVSRLYEEGPRKARSSDSSRRTRLSLSVTRTHATLATNIQKMFNERIEIFSPVEFSRVSVLTGIVKVALKALLECVRMRTFSRFGFQQLQVDAHYLHLYLWRFVSDENLVTHLLDEVMSSVAHRCSEPVPMEPSVIDVICDRG